MKNLILFFRFSFVMSLSTGLLFVNSVRADEKGMSFQAMLKDQSGNVISAPSGVPIRVQILSPNSCVLREELFASVPIQNGYLNLALLKGVVQGSGVGGKDPGLSVEGVFNNMIVRPGLICVNSDGSANGVGSFDPSVHGHARKLRLLVDLSSVVPGESLLANFNIRSMAFAARADRADNTEMLSGKTAAEFANINAGANLTQANLESIFSNYSRLDALLTTRLDMSGNYIGNATTATTATQVSGVVGVPNGGTGVSSLATNSVLLGNGVNSVQVVAPGASGNVLTSNGTTWVSSPASGSVTSVASKTGAVTLVAADITDFATQVNSAADARIALARGAVNGVASLDSGGKVPSAQLSLSASDIPSLDAAKIGSGVITNNVSSASVSATTGQFANLGIYDGTKYLFHKAPTGGFLSSGYNVEWPAGIGSINDVLQITGVSGSTATLSWAAPATGGVSALTGDVTASGSGAVAATIANDAVTFSKMQNVSSGILLGRHSSGSGDTEEITLGSGLSLSGGTLAATGSGGTVTSVDLAAPSFMSVTGGPLTSTGTLTLGMNSQVARTVLAAPVGASGAPTFRLFEISDVRSTTGGNPAFFNVSGGCSSGQMLSYSSLTDQITCSAYSLDAGSVGSSQLVDGSVTAGKLADTTVGAGSYGSATQIPSFTVDAQGRLTAAGQTTVTPAWAQVTGKPTTISGYGLTDAVNKTGDTMTGALNLPSNGLVVGTNELVVSGTNVGVGTATTTAKLTVAGSVVSPTNEISSGGSVNLALSNLHYLASVGGPTITLSNMVNGGVYTLVVAETTSRTYSFSGCNSVYASPALGATTASTRTIFGLTTIQVAGNWHCYITWATGFAP